MATDEPIWLVVGLGNPGPKYERTRHNVGFMVVERWVDQHATPGVSAWREKFQGRLASVTGAFGRAFVLEPLTYMNRSGQSVSAALKFFRIPPDRMLVVHDELDFEFGRIAIKTGGGHGGHNGLRDIIAATQARDFVRVRVGVGRPPSDQVDVADWLLSDFGADHRAGLGGLVGAGTAAVTEILSRGVAAAMNSINRSSPRGPDDSSNR